MRSKLLTDPWVLISVLLLVGLAFLVVYPQLWIARESVSSPTGAGIGNYIRFFTDQKFLQALWNSVWTSLLAMAFAALIAVPLAYVLAKYEVPFKAGILSLVTMSSISPPFLGACAWVILLGRFGILSELLRSWGIPFTTIVGPRGIVWVEAWITFPLIFLLVYDSLVSIDPSLEEASMSVGANRRQTALSVSLPLALPGILTGCYLSLMAAFADFGTPMIIGGGFPVLPVLVYGEFLSEVGGDLRMASTSSIVMVAVSTAVLLLQRYLVARKTYASITSPRRATPARASRLGTALITLWAFLVLVISFTPHLVVLVTSFLKWSFGIVTSTFTLANYKRLASQSLLPIPMSFFLAGLATLLDVLVGTAVAYVIVRKKYRFLSPALNSVVMIPYIIPGTVLGIGLIIAFNTKPLLLTGTWMILCLAYFIRKLPFAAKAAESALYQVHPSLEEAALSVGATPLRTFKDVVAPMILPGIVTGGTMAFLMNITEISSTVILYSAPWITMTVVIFVNATMAGSDFGVASAMTVVLMASVYIPLYLVNRFGRGKGVQVGA
ncbi:MAG: iron ABC transporter permease [Firmicutes bacterium]|nr:iron ABC transporter permease [Bacillota bacterium]